MTLDHDIVRAVIKNFPNINEKYESLPELGQDYETLRECHIFFQKLACADRNLLEEVNVLMFTWRSNLMRQMSQIMLDRHQKCLVEFGIPAEEIEKAMK